jgi:hypothetical protein
MQTRFSQKVFLCQVYGKASWKRFLHPLEGHLVKWFNPVFWAQTRETLKTLIRDERGIEIIWTVLRYESGCPVDDGPRKPCWSWTIFD